MINVTHEAADWFKDELGIEEGQAVRFFARYSAGGILHPGFSLGLQVEPPMSAGISSVVDGITFFMEDKDMWYLDGYHLQVAYDQAVEGIDFQYIAQESEV
ncbi:Iron-sulfur cluster biosynthesis [compost metagenome]